MTLTDWAAIAQIASALLIIPSLIYLALQIRQSTRQARATASQQYLETNKDLNLALISNKQVASLYRRGSGDFECLDEDEKTQFFFFTAQYYQTFSIMHSQWRAGSLPESAWHPIRKHLISMMAMAGTRHVWDSWARTGLPADFIKHVEALHISGEATYALHDGLTGRRDPGGVPHS